MAEAYEQFANAAAQAIKRHFGQEQILVLTLRCEKLELLRSIQDSAPNCKLLASFENDFDFLMAERFLKDTSKIQAIDRKTLGLFRNESRRFDVIIDFRPGSSTEEPVLNSNGHYSLLRNGGILILPKILDTAEEASSDYASSQKEAGVVIEFV